jgi:hypothetical protein
LTVRFFFANLHRRQPVLSLAGWATAAGIPVFLWLAAADDRTLLGENVWLKPLRFSIAFTMFFWTIGWMLDWLPDRLGAKRTIAWGTSLALVTELPPVVLQAARGVRSHFNWDSVFDSLVYASTGVGALVQAGLVAWLFVLCFRCDGHLSRLRLWGVRLGIAGFLLGTIPGLMMVALNSHSVGAADGGDGMPLAHWSSTGGDLRVAHFFGLHALQVFPLSAYLLERLMKSQAPGRRLVCWSSFAAAYGLATLAVLIHALCGRLLWA